MWKRQSHNMISHVIVLKLNQLESIFFSSLMLIELDLNQLFLHNINCIVLLISLL